MIANLYVLVKALAFSVCEGYEYGVCEYLSGADYGASPVGQ